MAPPKTSFAVLSGWDEDEVATPLPPRQTFGWLFDTPSPCNCCSPLDAVIGNHFLCQDSGRSWLIRMEEFNAAVEHTAEECQGGCSAHPLLKGVVLDYQNAMNHGGLWGDLAFEEEAERLAKETPLQRMQRLARLEREENERRTTAEAAKMAAYAAEMKMRNSGSRAAAGKIPQPCKWLYTPSEGVFVNHVCSECWAHEYKHPKTGKIMTPRTCNRLHPGEAGWCNEWVKNRNYVPPTAYASSAQQRFSALSGGGKRRA